MLRRRATEAYTRASALQPSTQQTLPSRLGLDLGKQQGKLPLVGFGQDIDQRLRLLLRINSKHGGGLVTFVGQAGVQPLGNLGQGTDKVRFDRFQGPCQHGKEQRIGPQPGFQRGRCRIAPAWIVQVEAGQADQGARNER